MQYRYSFDDVFIFNLLKVVQEMGYFNNFIYILH